MKKLSAVLSLMALTLGLCSAAFAATEYVIVNHDSSFDNFLSVYTLDTSNGALNQVGLLDTNGTGLGGLSGVVVNFANIEQAITPGGSCIFAVFSINADGSLTTLSRTAVTGQHLNVFSLTLFPNTR